VTNLTIAGEESTTIEQPRQAHYAELMAPICTRIALLSSAVALSHSSTISFVSMSVEARARVALALSGCSVASLAWDDAIDECVTILERGLQCLRSAPD
jgi:hypothetical protein